MASSASHIDHLASIPIFSSCSKRDLQKIAKASNEVSIPEGQRLVDQGDQGKEAFVIISGKAAVKRNNRKFTTLGPGDTVGELSLLDKGPRTASVVAETPIEALVLTTREFTGLLDEIPGLAHKIMAALAGRIRQLDAKLVG